MEGYRSLRSLTLRNVLSFGPEGMTLDFEPLNVLIGANGSGKSNLIEVLGLLRALPTDLSVPIREGGGFSEWIWKGSEKNPSLQINSEWVNGSMHGTKHSLELWNAGRSFEVAVEVFSDSDMYRENENYKTYFRYDGREDGSLSLYDEKEDKINKFSPLRLNGTQSILSQLKDAERYPGLTYLSDLLSNLRLFRNWTFGPTSPLRTIQKADLPGDFLLENGTNLGLILNTLMFDKVASSTLIGHLRKLYEGANEVRVKVVGGYVEINIMEHDEIFIPASRLSDGTLRYLTLLAILCHPEPPPLICIEEPEVGLHPDIIPTIAELLLAASKRTQLIVTTHSADLVSALWEFPESVVVCDRGAEGARMRRLEPEQLKTWLERYSLGELWGRGEIGGNRW